ncbi:MAG: thioredoxin domain-containing protein [Opitutaceae bacterium]|nr:thioredoxin domain-containing protein [Opitutaceae bacterium]
MTPPPAPRNSLAETASPYLQQHAANPVAWLPWGEEAFARARAEQKPVFLSIGYSTCHWCHVMAHESFEDPAIAALLNTHFVPVKVDREERPDVDRLHMAYVQAVTGQGGWPLSVWLTPELEPFYGGTYFPPADRWGRPGFATVLEQIAAAWAGRREDVCREGARVLEALRAPRPTGASQEGSHDAAAAIGRCLESLEDQFDPEHGGFGSAPKFPRPVGLNLVFRALAGCTGDEAAGWRQVVETTLGAMAAGGVYDHLGGGFHRYSVDTGWRVPHFEKMLYDQAQLVVAYLEGWQATGRERFATVARETLAYLERDLAGPEGGYCAAEDADSARPEHPAEHAEGAFYVWTQAEVETVCGADAGLVCAHFGIEPGGNAPAGTDPQGELDGRNVLYVAASGRPAAEAERLEGARAELYAARALRPRPGRDDKIVTAWNGLALSALARAAQVLDEPRWLERARRTATYLRTALVEPKTGRLWRSRCGGRAEVAGFAEDYACLIAGLLDFYEAGGGAEWLRWAAELQEQMDALFRDPADGGYYGSAAGDASILVRMKESYDGAEPAAGSVAALNLLRLAALLGREDWRRQAEETIASLRPQWSVGPHALPQLLVAVDFSREPVQQWVFAGRSDDPALRALVRESHRRLERPRVILWADGDAGQEWLVRQRPELTAMVTVGGRPALYLCREATCLPPITEVAEVARVLG